MPETLFMRSSKVEQWFSSISAANDSSSWGWLETIGLFLLVLVTTKAGDLIYSELRRFFVRCMFQRNIVSEEAESNSESDSGISDAHVIRRPRSMPTTAPNILVDEGNDRFHFAQKCPHISRKSHPTVLGSCTTCLQTNSIYFWTEPMLFLTQAGNKYHHSQCVHVATTNSVRSRNRRLKDTLRGLTRCICVTEEVD